MLRDATAVLKPHKAAVAIDPPGGGRDCAALLEEPLLHAKCLCSDRIGSPGFVHVRVSREVGCGVAVGLRACGAVEINNFVVRRAVGSDAAAVAEVWLRSFTAALPGVCRAHTDDQVRSWFREVVVPGSETWVVTVEGVVVAMMVLGDEELDQLYLDPAWQGRGIGDRLVEVAKQRRPAGLALWTFQVNEPARRFYERHGFVAGECTDGHRNEEREPDVRYRWRPEREEP